MPIEYRNVFFELRVKGEMVPMINSKTFGYLSVQFKDTDNFPEISKGICKILSKYPSGKIHAKLRVNFR